MKRLLLVAILGLAALFQLPGRVSASGAFGLFTCGGCCKKCGCEVCIRPYNAFSPVLCGSICVDNCFPFVGPQCACAPRMGGPMGLPPAPMVPLAPGPYGPGPYGPGAYAPAPYGPAPLPPMQAPAPLPGPGGAPASPPGAAPAPLGTPANPEPLRQPKDGQNMTYQGMGMMPYGMVQPAAYYPYSYPGYMPYYQPIVPMAPMYPYPMMPQYPVQN